MKSRFFTVMGANAGSFGTPADLMNIEGAPAVLAVGQDFTERRDAQERLLRSERLAGIGQMITGIAHESRNALQRIQSCTEMLELEIENNQEAQRLVRRLQEAQDNLLRLFDEVRGYAAPIQLERESCRIDSIWREAWDSLETVRRGRDAVLVENACDTDLTVLADRFRIVQVFRNLLENSLAACSDPVAIQIECRDAQLQGQPGHRSVAFATTAQALRPPPVKAFLSRSLPRRPKGLALAWRLQEGSSRPTAGKSASATSYSSGAEFVITLLRANT